MLAGSTLTQLLPPVEEPLGLDEVKAHLRVDHDLDDALLTLYLAAARQWCEETTRRSFMTQTWQLTFPSFPAPPIWLPRPPLQALLGITYLDADGTEQTLAPSTYVLQTTGVYPKVWLARGQTWPVALTSAFQPSWSDVALGQPVLTLTYEAGYDTALLVPAPLKQAILLLVGHYYEHREEASDGAPVRALPHGVMTLLSPYLIKDFY